MRGFLILLIIGGLGYLYYKQPHRPPAAPVTAQTTVSQPARPVTPVPQLTPAPRGEASKYNYMKRALDRAADVRDQSRAQTADAQNP